MHKLWAITLIWCSVLATIAICTASIAIWGQSAQGLWSMLLVFLLFGVGYEEKD